MRFPEPETAAPQEPDCGSLAAVHRYLAAAAAGGRLLYDAASAPPTYRNYPRASRVRPAASQEDRLLATLMRQSLGVSRYGWWHAPTGSEGEPVITRAHRPAPSGGGLNPVQAYLAAATSSVPAGLYHYDAGHDALQLVRPGDHRADLARLVLPAPYGPLPLAVMVLSGVFWANGFKYGEFGYQLQCLEVGALLAQVSAVACGLKLAVRSHVRFDGPAIDALLGCEPAAEGTLGVLTLGVQDQPENVTARRPHGRPAAPVPEPVAVTGRLPRLLDFHRLSTTLPAHAASTAPNVPQRALRSAASRVTLPPVAAAPVTGANLVRMSAPGGFTALSLDAADIGTVLAAAARHEAWQAPDCALFLVALRVRGVPVGSYLYDGSAHQLLRVGDGHPLGGERPLAPATGESLAQAAALLIPSGGLLSQSPAYAAVHHRVLLSTAGAATHRAALAAAALGLASRIHSDLCGSRTDASLSLNDSGYQSLTALLVGAPATRRVPALFWCPLPEGSLPESSLPESSLPGLPGCAPTAKEDA